MKFVAYLTTGSNIGVHYSESCLPAIASSGEAGGPRQARLDISGTLKPELWAACKRLKE